jgi:hypothetical protein
MFYRGHRQVSSVYSLTLQLLLPWPNNSRTRNDSERSSTTTAPRRSLSVKQRIAPSACLLLIMLVAAPKDSKEAGLQGETRYRLETSTESTTGTASSTCGRSCGRCGRRRRQEGRVRAIPRQQLIPRRRRRRQRFGSFGRRGTRRSTTSTGSTTGFPPSRPTRTCWTRPL